MSMTFFGWLLIVSSIVIPALVVFSRSDQLPLDIGARLQPRKHSDAESGAARLGLFAWLRSSSSAVGEKLRGTAGTLGAAAAVFILVAGIGTATSYVREPYRADISEDASDSELLGHLTDYARSAEAKEPASKTTDSKLLPDVNTMTERLKERLEATPNDVQGWRMLGWAYFNTGRYDQAASAYAKAAELDPNSAELKAAYEEAKAKASGDPSALGSTSQTEAVAKSGDGHGTEKIAEPDAVPPHESNAAIRSMVDGLAARLENSPRDVEGWTRLMRSRVVLGEREVAATAFRKALDVFKDDSGASGQITAAAVELGLKAE